MWSPTFSICTIQIKCINSTWSPTFSLLFVRNIVAHVFYLYDRKNKHIRECLISRDRLVLCTNEFIVFPSSQEYMGSSPSSSHLKQLGSAACFSPSAKQLCVAYFYLPDCRITLEITGKCVQPRLRDSVCYALTPVWRLFWIFHN